MTTHIPKHRGSEEPAAAMGFDEPTAIEPPATEKARSRWERLKSFMEAAALAFAFFVGFPALSAAWLWFDWPMTWIPIAYCIVLGLVMLVGYVATMDENRSQRENVGTTLAMALFCTPLIGVAVAGNMSPAGDDYAPASDSSVDSDYYDDYSEPSSPDVSEYEEPTSSDDGYIDPSEAEMLMDEFGSEVCDYVGSGGDIADIGKALENTGEVTAEEGGVIAGVVGAEYC